MLHCLDEAFVRDRCLRSRRAGQRAGDVRRRRYAAGEAESLARPSEASALGKTEKPSKRALSRTALRLVKGNQAGVLFKILLQRDPRRWPTDPCVFVEVSPQWHGAGLTTGRRCHDNRVGTLLVFTDMRGTSSFQTTNDGSGNIGDASRHQRLSPDSAGWIPRGKLSLCPSGWCLLELRDRAKVLPELSEFTRCKSIVRPLAKHFL